MAAQAGVRVFTRHDGLVAPFDQLDVDTDLIIPKQFLVSISRTGFGPHLFDSLRYQDEGRLGQDCSRRPLNPDFVLNQPHYQGASILLTRHNFGCGSSREHAVWALLEFGFRCLVGPGFSDIFFNNCFKNGLLPVVLPEPQVPALFERVAEGPGLRLTVDLEQQRLELPDGRSWAFEVDAFRRRCLLEGLDEIGLSLESAPQVRAFEKRRRLEAPWVFRSAGHDLSQS